MLRLTGYGNVKVVTDIRNARLEYRQQEPTHLMENVVFNELRARGYSGDVGLVEIETRKGGKREKRQQEIDFFVNFPEERVYVQSAYAMPTDEKREQEILPLRKTGDSFRKIVVTGDYQDPWKDDAGVMHIGVIPFLLDKTLLGKWRLALSQLVASGQLVCRKNAFRLLK